MPQSEFVTSVRAAVLSAAAVWVSYFVTAVMVSIARGRSATGQWVGVAAGVFPWARRRVGRS